MSALIQVHHDVHTLRHIKPHTTHLADAADHLCRVCGPAVPGPLLHTCGVLSSFSINEDMTPRGILSEQPALAAAAANSAGGPQRHQLQAAVGARFCLDVMWHAILRAAAALGTTPCCLLSHRVGATAA